MKPPIHDEATVIEAYKKCGSYEATAKYLGQSSSAVHTRISRLIAKGKLEHRPVATHDEATVIEAYKKCGSYEATAKYLGQSSSAVRQRIWRLAAQGKLGYEPVPPGFEIAGINHGPRGTSVKMRPEHGDKFKTPTGHAVKGVSALVDADGRVVNKWVKTREDGGPSPEKLAELFKREFTEVKRFEPLDKLFDAKGPADLNLLNFIPCNDWHINMLAWKRETGESWDLSVAERVISSSMRDVIRRSPEAGTAVILGGGDLMHNDDNSNRTAKSGNVLDADGRWRKGIETAQRLMVAVCDEALLRNGVVHVRLLPGNHDEYSSVALSYWLKAKYEREPRLMVDVDGGPHWFLRFGKVFLAATHGHQAKLTKLPALMVDRNEDWGATKFRYGHGFHVHHVKTEETLKVILESHSAPIPNDAWHHGMGYGSQRRVQTITYHQETGEFGRVVSGIAPGVGNEK